MNRMYMMSLVLIASLGGLIAWANSMTSPSKNSEVLQEADGKISQISAENVPESELYIQEASVKEISGDQFRQLVGEPQRYPVYTSYPEVTLLNRSSKTITGFIIMVESAAEPPKSGHGLFKNIAIAPGGTLKLTPNEWLKAERKTVHEGDKFISSLRRPGPDSASSWLAGAAPDLKVKIGLIEFEDGTRWMIPPDSDSNQ